MPSSSVNNTPVGSSWPPPQDGIDPETFRKQLNHLIDEAPKACGMKTRFLIP
ncbi:MAG: hypothetical protein OSA84_08140 [Akkermansiaceae bacterium]|nr:hypothetical protein [Akkermansiaceae bacterium]